MEAKTEKKFVCPNIGTLAECRPERGWDTENDRPIDCVVMPCIYGELFERRLVVNDVPDNRYD